MIRVTVAYPKQAGAKFDFDYYLKTHMPLVGRLLGSALRKAEVYEAVGGPGGAEAKNVCVAELYFDSVEAFGEAFGPVSGQIMSDVRNYTDIEPEVQIGEQVL